MRFARCHLLTGLFYCLIVRLGACQSGDEPSVVKLDVLKRTVNLSTPWKKSPPTQTHGTGFFIDESHILTNAHVVMHGSEIVVNLGAKKYDAKILTIAPEVDLALLDVTMSLEEKQSIRKVDFADRLPPIRSTIQVLGFPVGGDSFAVTQGIVSRIEYAPLSSEQNGLRLQVDAALNPGNSGGPAMMEGKMIGVSTSRLGNADNIGYLISVEEVKQFLADVQDGSYEGKPILFENAQPLENLALRKKLSFPNDLTGIWIQRTPPGIEPSLVSGDVLMKIGDYPVSNTGTVKTEGGLELACHFAVSKLCTEGKVQIEVFRNGRVEKLNSSVVYSKGLVIPALGNRPPSYFVFGPMVLIEATSEYMQTLDQMIVSNGNNAARQGAVATLVNLERRSSPLVLRRFDHKKFPTEQLVMVGTNLLPHPISRGYASPAGYVVKSVNGIEIQNLQHLVELIRDEKSDLVCFSFHDTGVGEIVFERSQVEKSMEIIMEENGVLSPYSKDLSLVWQSKTKADP